MKRACDCRHVRHCPFVCPPLELTDLEGQQLYREPTGEEQEQCGGKDPVYPLGAVWEREAPGQIRLVGIAHAPEKAADYALSKEGRRCKAENHYWLRTHASEEEA